MITTVPLRQLAELNPPTPAFDELPADADVCFMPLEAVWNDTRADHDRTAVKSSVATGYVRFQPADVLCPKVTPTFQAGRATIARSIGAGSTEIHVLRPRLGVDPRWVSYAVRSKHFLDEGVTAFQGVAGLQRVPAEFVNSFRIADVDTAEQRRIADFLDDRVARIDQIIAARREQLRLIELLQQQHLYGLVGINYPTRRLGSVLILGAVGVVVNPSTYFRDSGVPFVHGFNVRAGHFDLTDLKFMSREDSARLSRSQLQDGDVLVVRAGYPGRAAVVPPALAGGNCASVLLLRPSEALEPQWLAAFMNSPLGRSAVERCQYGAAQGVINLSDVLGFEVPLPPRAVQRERLAIYTAEAAAASAARTACDSQITLLQEYKQSLITAAVTGEFDVTTASTKIPEN